MQHDEVIWQVIRHNHCSFMTKITAGNFCRNPYSITGICNRSSCPLANSRYATIRDHDGLFYLYMKTIERAHMPDKLWERVKLPLNYEKALEIIDTNLAYWPKFLVHKIKQRLTKMTQYRIRMRRLQLKVREKIMTMPRKEKKREARREAKAEKAAVLDKNIEKELLERLKRGIYGDIYNYPVNEYNKVLEMEGLQAADKEEEEEEEEVEPEMVYVEGYDDLEQMTDDIEEFYVPSSYEPCKHDNDGTLKDEDEMLVNAYLSETKRKHISHLRNQKQLKKPRVIVEVDREDGGERQKVII